MADSVDERLPEKKTSSSPHPSSSQPQQEQLRHRDPRDGRDLDRPPNLRDRSPSERSPSPHRDEKRCRRDDDSLRDSRFGELMSFKEFVQSLVDDTSPSEAVRKYEEYKSEYITEQKRLYFTTYKEEEWLKNMYHPTSLMNVIKRRYALAQEEAKTFLLALQKGTLDLGPAVNMSGRTSEPNSEDEAADGGERRRSDRGEAKETELVSSAPKAPSFTSDPKRIPTDIEQAQALVRKLDSEKGIEENVLSGSEDGKPVGSEKSHTGSTGPVTIERGLASVKGLEGVELLDTLVTYLWRVHGVDYYGKIEAKEAKGLRHVRAQGKGPEAKGDESENRFDSYWQERLKAPNPLKVIKHKIATEVSHPLVQKISDDKYGCRAKDCTKLFRAPEYVDKHLHQSHKDLLTQRMHKVAEEVYFQNYMRDLNAPTNFAETKKDNENVEAVPEPKKQNANKVEEVLKNLKEQLTDENKESLTIADATYTLLKPDSNDCEILLSWTKKNPHLVSEALKQKYGDCWAHGFHKGMYAVCENENLRGTIPTAAELVRAIDQKLLGAEYSLESPSDAISFLREKYKMKLVIYHRPKGDNAEEIARFEEFIDSQLAKAPVALGFSSVPGYGYCKHENKEVFGPTPTDLEIMRCETVADHCVLATGRGVVFKGGEFTEFLEIQESQGPRFGYGGGLTRFQRYKNLVRHVYVFETITERDES